MVIGQQSGDEPETFECLGKGQNPRVFACGGGQRPVAERHGTTNHCNACENGLATFDSRIRSAIHDRNNWQKDGAWSHWNSLTNTEKTAQKEQEKALFRAVTSTACDVVPDAWLIQWPLQEGSQPWTEVEQVPSNTPLCPNNGIEIHPDLPAGQEGGHQITDANGHVYILTHPLMDGWLKIGMTRYPNSRLINYNTGDPEKRYQMEHTVEVPHQRDAESYAHEQAESADSFEGRSETGRREWFRMSLEDARAILNQIGTPLENDD